MPSKHLLIEVASVWTVTTLVPMFGDMGLVISPDDYPVLAMAHNGITRFFVQLYSSDRFITVSITANICAVMVLAWLTLRPPKGLPQAQAVTFE